MTRKRTISEASNPPTKRIRHIASSWPQRLRVVASNNDDDDENDTTLYNSSMSPQDYLMKTLHDSTGSPVKLINSLDVPDFFSPPTSEEINAYSHDVLTAIRTRDIKKLREFHHNGRPLKCSNQFGESLLHLACRRGFDDVVDFLVNEAGVTEKVMDDYGRTPLHDVCWTCTPNFQLLELLLQKCPTLLLLKDKRGHAPLDYVRREHWSEYVEFLSSRKELFVPETKDEDVVRVVG